MKIKDLTIRWVEGDSTSSPSECSPAIETNHSEIEDLPLLLYYGGSSSSENQSLHIHNNSNTPATLSDIQLSFETAKSHMVVEALSVGTTPVLALQLYEHPPHYNDSHKDILLDWNYHSECADNDKKTPCIKVVDNYADFHKSRNRKLRAY